LDIVVSRLGLVMREVAAGGVDHGSPLSGRATGASATACYDGRREPIVSWS
jgi:hypothetical protein